MRKADNDACIDKMRTYTLSQKT